MTTVKSQGRIDGLKCEMSESEAASTQADLDALKALEADASELERIEGLLDRFNIFEVIGFVGQEVAHSRFLAFLLDPKQNHGLGDLFLKSLLQKVSETPDGASLPRDLSNADDGSLSQTTVQTEVYTGDGRIDILLLNEVGQWAMIIENKIWTTEHSDQLDRYYRFVKKRYPDWKVVCVYLTPRGDVPSHPKYTPLDYKAVCQITDSTLKERDSTLRSDVQMSMQHYAQMVRRQIVGDPEVVELCRNIYRKHKKALDLIYKHRPDLKVEIHHFLTELINNAVGLIYKSSYKNDYIWFRPQEWEQIPALNADDSANGILRFAFLNDRPDRLALVLEISRGNEEIRRKLYAMGQKDRSLFNDLGDPETYEKPKLYRRTFLTREQYETASDTERVQELRRQWDEFLDKDLPQIKAVIKKETGVGESIEPAEGPMDRSSRFGWEEGDIVITKWPEHED